MWDLFDKSIKVASVSFIPSTFEGFHIFSSISNSISTSSKMRKLGFLFFKILSCLMFLETKLKLICTYSYFPFARLKLMKMSVVHNFDQQKNYNYISI